MWEKRSLRELASIGVVQSVHRRGAEGEARGVTMVSGLRGQETRKMMVMLLLVVYFSSGRDPII